MKKLIFKIVFFLFLMVFAVLHFYSFTHLRSYDEIWVYGFGVNIFEGLIPYKDFNMVITPFFPYIVSLILGVFGKKLIVYHVLISGMITFITYLASKKIKIYSLLIYVSLLIFAINGYNTSTLLWLMLLLSILDKNNKYKDFLVPIIVGIMILTKQTMLLLVIPSLIYSKNRKKTFGIYVIMFLLFMLYLIVNNNLIEFFDYCLFGMFDFANSNGSVSIIILLLQIIVCSVLLFMLIKSNGKKQDVCYVLLYQVMSFPILEIYHFVLGWSAFIYVLFGNNNVNDSLKKALFIFLLIIEVCLVFTNNEMFTIRDRKYFYEYPLKESFMYKRKVHNITEGYIYEIKSVIDKYEGYDLYIFGNYSYLVKLELCIKRNKFDLINNGNMGYKGEAKYISEIRDNCKQSKCLFIVDYRELLREDYSQVNRNILEYVVYNYDKVGSSSMFNVYIN